MSKVLVLLAEPLFSRTDDVTLRMVHASANPRQIFAALVQIAAYHHPSTALSTCDSAPYKIN
jgi:hypothetical protein